MPTKQIHFMNPLTKQKKYRIGKTPNLLTDANRSTDTEEKKTYKDFSSFWEIW